MARGWRRFLCCFGIHAWGRESDMTATRSTIDPEVCVVCGRYKEDTP